MTNLNVKNRTLFIRDNLNILDNLNSDSVDLIYLDPPFNSNRNYAAPIGSKAAGSSFKDIWTLDDIDLAWIGQIAEKHANLSAVINAAGLVGGKGDKSYLVFMARRLLEMKRILKETGSIYLHCDTTMSHSLKLVMDCIFGKANFRNEIIWCYTSPAQVKNHFPRKHDIILFYAQTGAQFNVDAIRVKHKRQHLSAGATGMAGGERTLEEIREQEELALKKGKVVEDWWNDIGSGSHMPKSERTGFKTQKPLALLERIIKASSNEGDVILDPFCGCATTLVAAERLNRQWIGVDLSGKAVDLIKMRLHAEKNLLTKHVWKGVITREDFPTRTDNGAIMVKPKEFKHVLYARQEGICAGCKYDFQFQNLTVDHIHPQSLGGQDVESNLQLLCGSCNSIKGNRSMEFLLARLKELGIIK